MNRVVYYRSAILAFGLFCALDRRVAGSPPSETALLHLRPELGGVEVYSRRSKSWRPFMPLPGKVLVVNLWSRSCEPCLAEMAMLKIASARWQRRGVEFLLIADPPVRMSRDEIVTFWERPYVDAKAGQGCPGQRERAVGGNFTMRCRLELPDVDPARSSNERLSQSVATETQPLTLLLDQHGAVRQAFVGSLQGRPGELDLALERLLAAVQAEKCAVRTGLAEPRLQKP